MIQSILVIVNPISGYARSRELPLALRQRLNHEGFHSTVHLTTGPDDAYNYTREHVGPFDLALAAGGDGTVRDVVSAAAACDVPVTILPTGTENLFAKEMGITADLDRVIETIKWGKTITIDMCAVNDQRFLMLSGVGFDARVLLHLNSFRRGNITHLTYFWPICRAFFEYNFPPVTVEADGEVLVEDTPGLAFVTNTARYAVGLRICRRARHDDGLLDVCFYKCRHQVGLLRHAWRTMFGRHVEHKDVVYAQAKKITVTSRHRLPFQTDGDPAGYLPARYSILPQALKIRVPSG